MRLRQCVNSFQLCFLFSLYFNICILIVSTTVVKNTFSFTSFTLTEHFKLYLLIYARIICFKGGRHFNHLDPLKATKYMHTFLFCFVFNQNNQADVEKATEVLSGYLERDISQDSLQDIKQKVQDKYR